jgi:hypothetical protein
VVVSGRFVASPLPAHTTVIDESSLPGTSAGLQRSFIQPASAAQLSSHSRQTCFIKLSAVLRRSSLPGLSGRLHGTPTLLVSYQVRFSGAVKCSDEFYNNSAPSLSGRLHPSSLAELSGDFSRTCSIAASSALGASVPSEEASVRLFSNEPCASFGSGLSGSFHASCVPALSGRFGATSRAALSLGFRETHSGILSGRFEGSRLIRPSDRLYDTYRKALSVGLEISSSPGTSG